jgi:hypothetical protein
MARLDVFVCDKCDTRVINTPNAGVENWVTAKFPYVLGEGRGGAIGDTKDMTLCPGCVRSIHEPYPKEISKP